ncbi:DUF2330 domain-containing protein [bacterium]|nr:MAG: DUF2330 domain-containing protein [bacterium]
MFSLSKVANHDSKLTTINQQLKTRIQFSVTPLLALSMLAPATCHACAMISDNPNSPIRITTESALIVWDSKSGTEHFIRRANFRTESKNFGFLVPTPTKPQLGAVQDQLFNQLEHELLPKRKTIVQSGIKWTSLLFSQKQLTLGGAIIDTAAPSGAPGGVEVIEQKRIGDYDAAVLKASDAPALLKWLREHRYTISPDTRDWLSPYIKAGYFLTAFQIAANVNTHSAEAGAIRLSFKSEAPFYPYREPESARKVRDYRSLRVFFVGDKRVDAQIANQGKSARWPGDLHYSAPLDAQKLKGQGLPLPDGPLRLTAFIDGSSPRPGWGDLNFAPASDQSELTPPPRIIYDDRRVPIPVEFVAIAAICLFAWLIKRRTQTSLQNT